MMSDDAGDHPRPDRLARFLTKADELIDRFGEDEATLLRELRVPLAALVATDDWLADSFAEPDPTSYRQYLLHCDPRQRYSVVSFVWGPGQETPIHDHTTWGLVAMLRGAEVSQAFTIVDDRLVPGVETTLREGEVAAISPKLGDVHRVRNPDPDCTAISIHVYGADIGSTRRSLYRSDGGVERFVSGYSNRASAPVSDVP